MKPIIVDMKDMSDTTEVYESRPNPFLIYFIYLLVFILGVALLWTYFSDIDIVVKSNGIFKSGGEIHDVSCTLSGKVEECNISEGQFVEKGDVLFTINGESIEETVKNYEEMLDDVNQRIEMLQGYEKCLDGEIAGLEDFRENKYYSEFANRKELLETSINSSGDNTQSQQKQYQTEKENIASSIYQYQVQQTKLGQVKECVKNRNNIFGAGDSYYSSIVESYISNYNVTSLQYDNQINEYKESLKTLEEQLKTLKKTARKEDTEEETSKAAIAQAEKEIEAVKTNITTTETEKSKALNNLELQQLASIEQQISTINDSIMTLKSNETSVQAQIDAIAETNAKETEKVDILSEKNSVASELLTYENKKSEYENSLKQYDMEKEKAKVTANFSGYISLSQEIKEGTYLQQGTSVCQILPEEAGSYYAEVYIENSDVARLEEGQQVKFEIAAYPTSEYGYVTGSIDTISRDIKVDQNSGSAYYVAKVKCDNTELVNKNGDIGSIMNGMACQAKVIVGKQSVLRYLLEKIQLVD